ncbi:MAG: glycosyltransferase family 1 protein [Bacteroidetes bacterium]|nr:glycosyltransferase family 1 protein [Bacteroidota bacterium]
MRIGIEGQRLFRPKKHGMDMVALELIRNLQLIDHENEYVLFIRPDVDNTVIRETPNFRIVGLEGGSYPLWEQISLPKAAKKEGCDLLHCTSNTAPLSTDIPLVITLHDIIYMEKGFVSLLSGSGTPYQRFGNGYRRLVVPGLIKKSRKIITVSQYERQRISSFFGMKDDPRLTSVYNGVSEHFHPVTDPGVLGKIKAKYSLPDDFFFFFGNTDPKKNTRGTIKAFADYITRTGSKSMLVMPDFDRQELDKIIAETGNESLHDRIKLTGYITNTDLPAIYSQCKVFLYPSLRESFGIPILEAMACGAPVITSNTSSMPEIAGTAAAIADPYNPSEITDRMIALTTDTGYRNQLIEQGFLQSAKFTWRSMAQNVLEIYREIGTKTPNTNN